MTIYYKARLLTGAQSVSTVSSAVQLEKPQVKWNNELGVAEREERTWGQNAAQRN